jgi:hypothetical protein
VRKIKIVGLTAAEQAMVETLAERGKLRTDLPKRGKLYAQFLQGDDNYTTALLSTEDNPFEFYWGTSKYNPNDEKLGIPFIPERGRILALRRALSG